MAAIYLSIDRLNTFFLVLLFVLPAASRIQAYAHERGWLNAFMRVRFIALTAAGFTAHKPPYRLARSQTQHNNVPGGA